MSEVEHPAGIWKREFEKSFGFLVSAVATSGLFDPAAGCAGARLVFLTVCPGFYRIDQAATGLGGGIAVGEQGEVRY